MVIYDAKTGAKLDAMTLPKSVDDLATVVSKYTGETR